MRKSTNVHSNNMCYEGPKPENVDASYMLLQLVYAQY